MNTKLYVGNLDYSVTDNQLAELFSQAGTVVSAAVITDRATGRSKGFGFVEMEDAAQAEEAIKKFNGTELQGRVLTVNAARPKRTEGF